jgi:CHAD domain-containing protein
MPRMESLPPRSPSTLPEADTPPLVAYLDHLVEELQRLIPMALRDWDDHAIHQSRVATRRLKAGIDLFRPVLSDDVRSRFARVTRKLRRRLGPLRDLDVMLGHLADLSNQTRHTTAVGWLAGRLQAQREAARGASLEEAPPAKVLAKLSSSWSDVRAEMLEAGEAVDSLLVESIHLQLDAFAEQADRLIRPPVPAGDTAAVPQDVHELRIAGKALRYTLEMAKEHGRPLDRRVMRTFKRMQEALGLWHDFVVLTEWAMRASLDGLLAHHDTNLQTDVLALARLTLSRAEQRLKKFGALWAKEGPQLTETIRAHFPLTQPAPVAAVEPPAAESEALAAPVSRSS